MNLRDRVVIVTGGGSGIGAALARRFAREAPRALVLADLDLDAAQAVAGEIDAQAVRVDVADGESNNALIDATEDRYGPIDLFCANAGIGFAGDEQTPAERWDGTPFTDRGFEHIPALEHLHGWLNELRAA